MWNNFNSNCMIFKVIKLNNKDLNIKMSLDYFMNQLVR